MIQFETYCKIRDIKATFKDGLLIDPLPKIKVGNRMRKEDYFVKRIMQKYPYSSIVEAMNNDKIILNL